MLSVLGAGQGVNAYTGNFSAFPADCTPSSACGIEVFAVNLTPPSACGVQDGMIEIIAENTSGNGLALQYSIDGGTTVLEIGYRSLQLSFGD